MEFRMKLNDIQSDASSDFALVLHYTRGDKRFIESEWKCIYKQKICFFLFYFNQPTCNHVCCYSTGFK